MFSQCEGARHLELIIESESANAMIWINEKDVLCWKYANTINRIQNICQLFVSVLVVKFFVKLMVSLTHWRNKVSIEVLIFRLFVKSREGEGWVMNVIWSWVWASHPVRGDRCGYRCYVCDFLMVGV